MNTTIMIHYDGGISHALLHSSSLTRVFDQMILSDSAEVVESILLEKHMTTLHMVYMLPQYIANLTQPLSRRTAIFLRYFVPVQTTLCMPA